MIEDKNPTKTPLADLGEFAIIDHITKSFSLSQKSSQI